ncbi:MAG: ABC transporter permease, partial [Chloroflexi bacterium]|nr:ABC transporter permease [Chloroflexota bacterium]
MIAERTVSPDSRASLWRVRVGMLSDSFRTNWSLFTRTKIGLVGLSIIGFYMLMALAYPVLTRTVWEPRVYDPVIGFAYEETRQPAPPSVRHLLGTDALGRDVLSQLMFSVRSEFMLGVVAALVTVVIATTVGAVSAYYGGIVD